MIVCVCVGGGGVWGYMVDDWVCVGVWGYRIDDSVCVWGGMEI